MALYRYEARKQDGDSAEGVIGGVSRYDALSQLQAQGLTVLRLRESEAAPVASASKAQGSRAKRLASQGRVRISMAERALFCRQLAISVGAGVPLRESLESIAEDIDNKIFAKVMQTLIEDLHGGKSFSQALAQHAGVFGTLFVALIRAAEEAGSLAQTLEYIAETSEAAERLRRRINGIIAYPVFIAIFFCIVCVVMTLFVLPQFQSVFGGLGARLPLITRVVFGINRFMIDNIWYITAGILAVIMAATAYGRTPAGRLRYDAIKIRLPVAGQWARKLAIARFTRNLGIMVRGGVPIATAMEITAGVCGNEAIRRSLDSARLRVLRGNDISGSMDAEGVFPRLVIRMIRVGESSGQLPEVLEKVASMYENEVESSLVLATSLLEPVILCVFGVIITSLVLAIYVPVFTVSTSVGAGG